MRLLLILLIGVALLSSSCRKNKTDVNGLPPATQEGKNTLGFLLNGEPWTPQGFNGTTNLSIDVDFYFNHGIFAIAAKRLITSSNIDETFGVGVKDSLNFMTVPVTLSLDKTSLYGARLSRSDCSMDFYDTSVYRCGSLTITKLDKANRVIAGVFNATLFKMGCSDTIKITEGRFDMKY